MAPNRRTVWLLSVVVLLVMSGISIIAPAVPFYAEALGATPFLIGVLVGALAGARVLVDFPSGYLGDRFGNWRMMQTGLAIIALTSALAVIAFDYWFLLGVRIAEGVGSGFYVTSSLAALARATPAARRGRDMSTYVGFLLVGQVVGPVLGGLAVAVAGLRAPFAAYSLLAASGMFLVALAPGAAEDRARGPRGARIDWAAAGTLLRNRSYVFVIVGTMSAFFIRGGLIFVVLPLYVADVFALPQNAAAAAVGLLITIQALTSMATMYPSGRWADRVGRKPPFVASLIGIGLLAPVIFLARDFTALAAVMAVYGLVLGLHGPLAAWAIDLTPPAVMGTSMGIYRTVGDAGFLVGPLVMGALIGWGGSPAVNPWPFLVSAVWLIASGLLLVFADDPVGRSRAHRVKPSRAEVVASEPDP